MVETYKPKHNTISCKPSRMEKLEMNPFILTALVSLILLWFITRIFLKSSTKRKVPPSPLKLPIIGNLHQLSSLPHHDFNSLAKKHGPMMLLHFGSVPVLVISSAELAREITRTHDLIFSSRPQFKAFKKLLYGCRDVATAPYGEYWRRMKSIFVLQMLSSERVRAFRSIREEETALFVNKIEESLDQPLNLSELFAEVNIDVVFRSTFGRRTSESESGKKFLRLMRDHIMLLLGAINIGDFIPSLAWINHINGFNKRLDQTAMELDNVLESLIEERQQIRKQHHVDGEQNGDEYLVDVLLDIYNGKTGDATIDRDSMKGLLVDVFVGGTDNISTALEWVMSEILIHPKVMEKLQLEVRRIVKQKQDITDDDLEKMHYLKAVIKEALRFHPPHPLLSPRISSKDVQVKGYDIPAGTVVMINAWGIARDPVSWEEPEKFMPERFLNSSIDFKGLDYEFIPFGTGRRGCPGSTYTVATLEIIIATLMLIFDWKLPNGVAAKDLDMTESPGIAVPRAVSLLAVASRIK